MLFKLVFILISLLAVFCISSCEKKYDFNPPSPVKKTAASRIYITKIEVLNFDFNKSGSYDPDLKPDVYLSIWPEDTTYFYTNVVNNISQVDLPLTYDLTTPYNWPLGSSFGYIMIYDQDGTSPQSITDDHLGSVALHLYSSDYEHEPGYTGYKILVKDGEYQALKVYFRCG